MNVDLVDETVRNKYLSLSLSLLHTSAVLPLYCSPLTLSFSPSPPSSSPFCQGEIRAFAFNEAADKMQAQLEMSQVRFPFSDISMFSSHSHSATPLHT